MASSLRSIKRVIPLFDRVLIERSVVRKESIGGIVLPDSAQSRSNTGKVIEVGPGARNPDGSLRPLSLRIGDVVLLPEFGGHTIKFDEKDYIVCREDEVIGKLEY
eukprot:TRINITY_DN27459_c0_g1_i1.p1 TRINITY_DN27459_c0_g1~~TRINITY_DN27459_c0_g1_i1.p1  ORF type:complete len:105 (-),score=44.07 TRINITY_DN27459_c0_g1_i1:128-442(-)